MACTDKSELWKISNEVQKRWESSSAIEKAGLTNALDAFKMTFETATGKEWISGADIGVKEMKKFNVEIQKLEKDLKSSGSYAVKFLRAFMPGFAKMRSHPVTRQFYYDIVKGNELRANTTSTMLGSYDTMVGSLKKAIVLSGSKNALKDLNKREKQYLKDVKNNNKSGVDRDLIELMRYLDDEGAVFEDFIYRSVHGKEKGNQYLQLKYKDQNKTEYISMVNSAASDWTNIQTRAKGHLKQGVENLKETIKLKYGATSKTAERLVEEYDKVVDNLDNVKDGYIPHYVLDVFTHSVEIPEVVSTSSMKDLDSVMGTYLEKVQDINTNLLQRLRAKSDKDVEYFSRNPLMYAHKYIEQVAGFNNNAYVSKTYIKALKKLTEPILKDPTSEVAKASETYVDMLNALHDKATHRNLSTSDSEKNNLIRMLTSLQFVSKLGFSTRGAIRNSTQSLLNFAYFGTMMMGSSIKRFSNDKDYRDGLNEQLAQKGLLFENINAVTEGALSNNDLISAGIDLDSGIVTFKEQNQLLDKLAKVTGNIAQASSVLTRFAENFNRRSTFKIAYHQRYKQLENSNKYANREEADYEAMRAIAGNYASKMTNLLHFDYSKMGKSDILTTEAGAVLGQFQHYAISFADLQYQMIKDYKRAFKAGDYTGPELGRIVRLASIYGLTELASGLSDINFTSYINNDTLGRFRELFNFLFGDEEQKMDAFYGKGAVGAIGLVPISDAIEVHNLGAAAGYWNLLADPESTAGWLSGMREYKKIDDTEFIKKIAGMTNIELNRILRRSVGPWAGPSIPGLNHFYPKQPISTTAAFRAEFGLYPGESALTGIKTSDMKKKWGKLVGRDLSTRRRGKKKGLSDSEIRQRALASLGSFN